MGLHFFTSYTKSFRFISVTLMLYIICDELGPFRSLSCLSVFSWSDQFNRCSFFFNVWFSGATHGFTPRPPTAARRNVATPTRWEHFPLIFLPHEQACTWNIYIWVVSTCIPVISGTLVFSWKSLFVNCYFPWCSSLQHYIIVFLFFWNGVSFSACLIFFILYYICSISTLCLTMFCTTIYTLIFN